MAAGWLDEEECHCEDAATAEAMINALRKVLKSNLKNFPPTIFSRF